MNENNFETKKILFIYWEFLTTFIATQKKNRSRTLAEIWSRKPIIYWIANNALKRLVLSKILNKLGFFFI